MAIETLALRGGPLLDEFAAIGPVHLLPLLDPDQIFDPRLHDPNPSASALAKADAMEVRREQRLRRDAADLRGFDVLYLNSATSAAALRLLPEIPPVVIAHIHELESAFNYWFPDEDRRRLLATDPSFVVVADRVGRNLVENHHVDPARITLSRNEFAAPAHPSPTEVDELRRSLGLTDEVVVGAMGTAEWRKGPDLFVQVASQLLRRLPDVPMRFYWVGRAEDYYLDQYLTDAARLGIADALTFVGEVENPATWLTLFDVFCLTSREDPFPLVCLEAGALATPIVSFDNGGMTELAMQGEGDQPLMEIVDYLDVEGMVDAVAARVLDADERRREGQRLQTWLDEHMLADGQEERIALLIDALTAERIGSRR
jgi:glycosyltransferase involved in cell wall biosynthesis